MKAKTIMEGHNGEKIINEGDYVIAIQGNKNGEIIMVNMDWSFDKDVNAIELKSMIGGFSGNLEELFGEKFVTQAIIHWAEETGKTVVDKDRKLMYLKGRGFNPDEMRGGEKNGSKT